MIVNASFCPRAASTSWPSTWLGSADVDAALEVRVGPDRVEVAQDDRPQVGGRGHVLEDLLHHPLGPGVRRPRRRAASSSVTSKSSVGGVERRGRGEQHPRLAQGDQLVEELQRLRDVVAVVGVGLLDRLGHHDPRGHVDGGVEVGVLLDDPGQQLAVGDVALIEDPVADEGPRAAEQRVEDDRGVAGLPPAPSPWWTRCSRRRR